jgi:predicted ribonuclease YlaK
MLVDLSEIRSEIKIKVLSKEGESVYMNLNYDNFVKLKKLLKSQERDDEILRMSQELNERVIK